MGKKYDVLEATEDAAKFGYSVGVFGAKLFYGVSGLSNLDNAMDSFVAERFRQRLDHFAYEHDNLSKKQKEDFYDDLKNNEQNVNYLYGFVEKTRTSTFDLHAKILAKLSVKLIKNKELNYFEDSLFANINIFSEYDFKRFYEGMKENSHADLVTEYFFKSEASPYIEQTLIQKYLNAGLISHISDKVEHTGNDLGVTFYSNEFTYDFYDMLEEILEEDK